MPSASGTGPTVKVPQLAWHGVRGLKLTFPSNWTLDVRNMAGCNRTALSPSQIAAAIREPTGIQPIRTLARNRKQVAIIFDDMSRATRSAQVVPFILEELAAAGLRDSSIRFIAATGSHAAMNRSDFAKKLGEETLRRFPVYGHNPFGDCVCAGTTSYGTEIYANAEVMTCDLKIAIGSVVPHPAAGFGGGTKIIMPGICSFETIAAFHRHETEYRTGGPVKLTDRSNVTENSPRLNMHEAARLVGLDFQIDTLLNSKGETVAIYAGEPEAAFAVAVQDARAHYLTALSTGNDVVVANTFAKASEFECGVGMAFASVGAQGGDIVLIGNALGGHVAHYLFGPWGTLPHPAQTQINIRENVNNLIIFTEYPDLTATGYFKQTSKVRIMSSWPDVVALLETLHPQVARVAVYPNADIQYY